MKILSSLLLLSFLSLQAQTTITVSPDKELQKVEGWGASMIWWAHMVGQWENEAKIDTMIDLLVSPDQLNMNIFRYNIGGGDAPNHYSTEETKGHMARGKGLRAEMEGFLDSPNAVYNWTRDAAQRKIMLKIKAKRSDVIFEAFSNSPPYWMTYSGCSAGNHDPLMDNLKPEYYEAYCDYLIEVCLHYKTEYGIEFKTLEPFNEPQTSYWNYKGGQEGCHFSIPTQIEIIKILSPKLKASGLKTVIAASDETSVQQFNNAVSAYLEAGITPLLGQLNVHTYEVNNEERREALALSKKTRLTLWQSETGPMGIKSKDFNNNLELALRLMDDMKIMQPTAWLDWQIMEEKNNTWGLIRGNFKNEEFNILPNLYVRMQVTRFIKQGYTIVDVDDKHSIAALSPKGNELVVVTLNLDETDKAMTYKLDNASKMKKVKMYRTSVSENCSFIESHRIRKNKFESSAKSKSIQTVIFKIIK